MATNSERIEEEVNSPLAYWDREKGGSLEREALTRNRRGIILFTSPEDAQVGRPGTASTRVAGRGSVPTVSASRSSKSCPSMPTPSSTTSTRTTGEFWVSSSPAVSEVAWAPWGNTTARSRIVCSSVVACSGVLTVSRALAQRLARHCRSSRDCRILSAVRMSLPTRR